MLNFFRKLLPNFEKNKLVRQIDTVKQTLEDSILPAVNESRKQYEGKRLMSEHAIRFEKTMVRRLSKHLSTKEINGFFSMVDSVSNHVITKLDILRGYLDKLFGDKVETSGLNFKQVEVLRLIDLCNFYNRYMATLVNIVLWEELNKKGIKTDKPYNDGIMKWMGQNEQQFYSLVEILATHDKQFSSIIDQTSEIIVSENEENVPLLGHGVDPFRLGFMPGIGSFILYIREWSLQNEADEYERNKMRLQSTNLYLQMLRNQEANNPEDEAIKRQIEYYNRRVQDLEYQIKKFETKAGVQ